MFTREYYQRRKDESLLRFIMRYVAGYTVGLILIGPPVLAIKAIYKGQPILPYLAHNLPVWFIAVPIAAVLCALYRAMKNKNRM